jgi:hypothetical protein
MKGVVMIDLEIIEVLLVLLPATKLIAMVFLFLTGIDPYNKHKKNNDNI